MVSLLLWGIGFTALLLYIYEKNGTKSERKLLGGALILLGAIVISPIPDPTDTIGFTIFSMLKGIKLSVDNLSVYFLEYTLLTIVLGVLLIFIGMRILNWNLGRILKKLDIGKYKIAVGIAIFAVLAVAILDVWSMNSGIFGSVTDYTLGNYTAGWWDLFFKFVLVLFLAVPISYFFLVRQDKSEALGIFGASVIMFFGGLADIAYFVFQKVPIPERLPWLDTHLFIGFISRTLGFDGVTNISLLVSVFIAFILTFIYVKILKENF